MTQDDSTGFAYGETDRQRRGDEYDASEGGGLRARAAARLGARAAGAYLLATVLATAFAIIYVGVAFNDWAVLEGAQFFASNPSWLLAGLDPEVWFRGGYDNAFPYLVAWVVALLFFRVDLVPQDVREVLGR